MKKHLAILMLVLSFSCLAGLGQEKYNLPLPASGNVTLPLDEYNKLIEVANKPAVMPESPPISFAMKRADLKLNVTNDSVLGTIRCDGEIFTKGIVRIPLLSAPAILDARQAGKALPIEQKAGIQTAVLSGPSDFSIILDAGISLNIEAGRASFTLPAPAAGSVQLSLEIPGEHTNVKITPGLITRRSTDNGRTVVEATLVPGQNASVWWTIREIAAPTAPRETRFLADVKTLASVGEADVRLAVLADLNVVQGEPPQFEVDIPAGFEIIGVTGASLESEEMQSGNLILKVDSPAKRSHQFLISLEKPVSVSKADIPFLFFKGAQRETGEALVEGEGTMELRATEGGVLKRIDVKETNSYLRALAHSSLHAAFRYHRQPSDPPSLVLEWNRFPDAGVIAAAAELVEVTTLVTSEGRSLTEVKLLVKNQAQPFLKVGLPSGATILTADISGDKVKPVQGSDGSRVPLLRPGFRPTGPYIVSFVFMHAGAPFAKKGDSELALPQMDIPISILRWEVFLPEMYRVKNFGGNAIAANLLPFGMPVLISQTVNSQTASGSQASTPPQAPNPSSWTPINLNIQKDALTSNDIRWPTGYNTPVNLNPDLIGEFKVTMQPVDAELGHGAGQQQISARRNTPPVNQASANVVNLQRRVSGVLPIRVDVPRAGNSYIFVRPLVLDEETKMTFKYKSK
jgi:hypothetical protein